MSAIIAQAELLYKLELWYGTKKSKQFFKKTKADPKALYKIRRSLLYFKRRSHSKPYSLS